MEKNCPKGFHTLPDWHDLYLQSGPVPVNFKFVHLLNITELNGKGNDKNDYSGRD
jgi:hypothetical protein